MTITRKIFFPDFFLLGGGAHAPASRLLRPWSFCCYASGQDGATVRNEVTKPGVNRHNNAVYIGLDVCKNPLIIFGSFVDIWENAEWPRFCIYCTYILYKAIAPVQVHG